MSTTPQWSKDFDKKFARYMDYLSDLEIGCDKEFKKFIREALQQEKKNTIREIRDILEVERLDGHLDSGDFERMLNTVADQPKKE